MMRRPAWLLSALAILSALALPAIAQEAAPLIAPAPPAAAGEAPAPEAVPAIAEAAAATDLRLLVNALAGSNRTAIEAAIAALARTGDAAVQPALEAFAAGDLYVRKTDRQVFIAVREGNDYRLTDPLTGEDAGVGLRAAMDKITVSNALRRAIRTAMGSLTLLNDDPSVRRTAADAMFRAADPETVEMLDTAIAAESDAGIRAMMENARAAAVLKSDLSDEEKLAAVAVLAKTGSRASLSVLKPIVAGGVAGPVQEAAAVAVGHIEDSLRLWDIAQNVWYGISAGSVLLLAAIGLAITFGVMGVINMAHGELVMIGAYTTFTVQQTILAYAPGLASYGLAFALPLAFVVAGLVGIILERTVIRWLYGRPLETLLATWGVSLILQQALRTIYGPTNRQVSNPPWMSGYFDLGQLTITYNRMWIVVFALAVFAVLMVVLRRTSFGLRTRAVTQNRPMASAMGIRTPWIDALTFGLGAGIAGIAGVALSQIENVSPDRGQSYIIDSFLVVVFGGVGNLWGTLVGALSLGVANKFIEPYAGAVLGKILVLVLIILFIQRRPRGLFALRGRAVEA